MKLIICHFVLFFSVLFLSGQTKHISDLAAIKEARISSNNFIAKHDVGGMSKFWTDDFVQVMGNATYLVGKDAIIASWKSLFLTNPNVSYERIPADIIISKNDSLAWETGKWLAKNSYSNGGNYSAMWIKRHEIWKIKSELFVSLR